MKDYGRIIILEDKYNNNDLEEIQMTFVKYINLPSKKILGF